MRSVRIAVRLHRYVVMRTVRRVYAGEADPAAQARLLAELNALDPERVIEVRDVIPRRGGKERWPRLTPVTGNL
jgi:hypothetical protein